MNFEKLFSRWNWREIPACPGRYVLSPSSFSGNPEGLLEGTPKALTYRSKKAPDAIWVVVIEGGGLISYGKADGTFVHTLNTPEGFQRKLRELEIEWGEEFG